MEASSFAILSSSSLMLICPCLGLVKSLSLELASVGFRV